MSRKVYTIDFKKDAVQVSLSGEKSKAQLARDLNITVNMLDSWIAKFGLTTYGMIRSTNNEVNKWREWLRDEHTRRLNYIYRQAQDAWDAGRREKLEYNMGRLELALLADPCEQLPLDEAKTKLLDAIRPILAEHSMGDSRFLRGMLIALSDTRKMWNVNITEKTNLPEQPDDSENELTEAERVMMIREVIYGDKAPELARRIHETGKRLPGGEELDYASFGITD